MILVQLLIRQHFNMPQKESALEDELERKSLEMYDHNGDYALYKSISPEFRKIIEAHAATLACYFTPALTPPP